MVDKSHSVDAPPVVDPEIHIGAQRPQSFGELFFCIRTSERLTHDGPDTVLCPPTAFDCIQALLRLFL